MAKRVCVIGAGAAGLAAAWSLARHNQRSSQHDAVSQTSFEVEIWEKASVAGGVATSEVVTSRETAGQSGVDSAWINDGVQGGAVSYRNTLLWHAEFGYKPTPVHMKVSFGIGDNAWNNQQPSPLVKRLHADIERFGRVLKWVYRLEPLFILIPIDRLLRWLKFSDDFCNHMVFPLTALFFGTGNQTPHVSAAVIARVFLDPDLRLFDYDPQSLLSQTPQMFAFPKLGEIYACVADRLHQGHGNDVIKTADSKSSSAELDTTVERSHAIKTPTGVVVRLSHPAHKVVRHAAGGGGVTVFDLSLIHI